VERYTKRQLASMIKKANSLQELADELGIGRSTLYDLRKRLGLI